MKTPGSDGGAVPDHSGSGAAPFERSPAGGSEPLEFEVHSPEAMVALGAALASLLEGGEIILLDGELGAGKTVFVRGLAQGLGVDASQVSSPTFVIMQRYDGGRLSLLHADAYRLRAPGPELEAIGWGEQAGSPGTVTVLEWASRVEEGQPPQSIQIEIMHAVLDTTSDAASTADLALRNESEGEHPRVHAEGRVVRVSDPDSVRRARIALVAGQALGLAPCPICGAKVTPRAATTPFCSPRCRSADLGRWLGGRYRVSRPLGVEDFDER